jgi:hypothetical protein
MSGMCCPPGQFPEWDEGCHVSDKEDKPKRYMVPAYLMVAKRRMRNMKKEPFLFPWGKLGMNEEINLWLMQWRNFVRDLRALKNPDVTNLIHKYRIRNIHFDGFKRINIDVPKR